MATIIKRDPWGLFFPHWSEDESIFPAQRGLKVKETAKDIIVEAVVAGVPNENVDINIEDGVLTIKAEAKVEEKDKDEYSQSNYQYYYTTALSGGQWDKAEAEVKHGIVKITIPKTVESRPKKITVKAK